MYLELLLFLAGAVGMHIIIGHWEVDMVNLRSHTPLHTVPVTVTVTRMFGALMCMWLHHVNPQGTVL